MWLFCFGVIGGLLLLYGGQSLLYRGRGGKMSRNGFGALVLGMVFLGCGLLTVVAPIAESGGNLLASIPIRDELKLQICGILTVVGVIGLLVLLPIIKGFREGTRK